MLAKVLRPLALAFTTDAGAWFVIAARAWRFIGKVGKVSVEDSAVDDKDEAEWRK